MGEMKLEREAETSLSRVFWATVRVWILFYQCRKLLEGFQPRQRATAAAGITGIHYRHLAEGVAPGLGGG